MDHKILMACWVFIVALQTSKCSQDQREKTGNDLVPPKSDIALVMDSNNEDLSLKVSGLVILLNTCERERDMLRDIVGVGLKKSEETTLKLKALVNACEKESNLGNAIADQSLRKLEEEHKQMFEYMVNSEKGVPYPGVAKYTKYFIARFATPQLTHIQPLKPEFGPVINDVLSLRYLINIPKCKEVAMGNEKRPSIFIAVISAAGNLMKRNIIRNTWKNHLKTVRDKRGFHFIHFGFFLGNSNDMATQKVINDESNTYRDIIQVDMLDNYKNLTLKLAGVLNWIDGNCKLANFVFKVDDDVYVNVHNLAYFIELNRQERNIFGRAPRMEAGRNDNNWGPMRDGQHGITIDAWPWPTYPNYIQGSAYLIHGDLIFPLLAAYQTTPMIPFEDVFLTGIATEKAGIKKKFSLGIPSMLANYAVREVCDAHNYIAWIGNSLPHYEVDNFYRGASQCYTRNSFGINIRVDYNNPLQFKFYV